MKTWEEVRSTWEPHDALDEDEVRATAGDVRDFLELIAALRAENERLKAVEKAARELDTKLDAIWNHPSYKGQITMAYVHGYEYDGPNCADEQKTLKEALKEVKQEK